MVATVLGYSVRDRRQSEDFANWWSVPFDQASTVESTCSVVIGEQRESYEEISIG